MRKEFESLTKEKAEEYLGVANTPSEFSRLCGVNAISGDTLKQVKEVIKNLGLDVGELDCKSRYKNNPKKCKLCGKIIPFKKRANDFCNSSCSATYTNTGRVISKEQKEKVSNTLKEKIKKGEFNPQIPKEYLGNGFGGSKYPLMKKCSVCGKEFIVENWNKNYRKTCSKKCATFSSTNRKYLNGSRKTFYYINRTQGEVVLESSWELKVVERLDELNISWIRPNPREWFDKEGKSRLYYPDFYLTDYNIYLDPKNPYCMSLDKDKIAYFDGLIKLIVGDLELVLDFVEKLVQ